MNRYSLLNCLKNEVSRLASNELDEDAIFAQLHVDPRFDTVCRSEVHSIYQHLKAKLKLKTKHERRITNARFEMERIEKTCQNASNFLVCDYAYLNLERISNIWQSRFVVTTQNSEIKVHDLFQNKSKSFKAEISGPIRIVFTLVYPFLLLIEHSSGKNINSMDNHYLHLTRFDPENDKLQTVQRLGFGFYKRNMCKFLVDQSDASKFALVISLFNVRIYKLVDGQIQLSKVVENLDLRLHMCASYCDDRIYDLQPGWNDDEEINDFTDIKVKICDLEQNGSKTVKLDSLPDNLSYTAQSYDYRDNNNTFELVRDCLFASVMFHLTDDYGIAFTNLEEGGWTVINFASYSLISKLYFVSGKDLIIYTEDSEIYKLPIYKPDSLRNMAWLKLVNSYSQAAGDNDPYNEALEYLPLNSDIQPFVFNEE